jgi:hypothetical protein
MTTITWNTTTIDGKEWLVVDLAKFMAPMEWDPSSQMFFAVAMPDGGIGSFPILAKGDSGETPTIDTVVDFIPLAYNDATPASAVFAETSPDVYRLALQVHEGTPGSAGTFSLHDAADITTGTLGTGQILVGTGSSTFGYQSLKVGDTFWPTTMSNTPSGNAAYTLCSVGIPAQPWAWRPEVWGQCVITGTAADVRVDLLARLDTAASGNIVGRGIGASLGVNASGIPTVLVDGPPAGSAEAYNKVAANTAATIYFRAERQSGGDTFTTSNTTTTFKVKVNPVP